MKKISAVCTVIAVSVVIASLCFAQMTDKTKQTEMMGDMSSIMTDMSGMMSKMAGMTNNLSREQKKMMAGIMKDLSQEMTNLSNMLDSGMMSDRELEKMRVRVMKSQQTMSAMEMKQ